MKKLSFEASIQELEEIVAKLENGEESLEESLKLFEKGTKLASSCYQTLEKAEQKITELSKLEEDSQAVSYTHLDVYKRQAVSNAGLKLRNHHSLAVFVKERKEGKEYHGRKFYL